METLLLVAAVAVVGFIGFKFYQKRRSSDIHPLDASVNKVEPIIEQKPEIKIPESNPHVEFPSIVQPETKVEVKQTEFTGFPKSVVETKPEVAQSKPKRGGRPKKVEAGTKPKATPTPRKKKIKTA